jgi:large subunit ribosomal protein L11
MASIDKPRKARLLVPAAKAKPSPAIGQALGQLGVNMMAFCKDFNSKTTHYVDEIPLRVAFTAFPDKTFSHVPLAPKSTWFLKQAANIHVGAHACNKEQVGTVHVKQLYEIAKIKKSIEPQLANVPMESYCRTLAATCGSMGIAVDTAKRDIAAGQKRKPAPKRLAAPEKSKGKKKK